MRRVASGIAVAVVAAVALAAAVDATRKALEPEPARAEPRPRPVEGLTLLSGQLVWTDARCRLRVTSLPTLQEADRPRPARCKTRLTRSGRLVPGRGDAEARLVASASGGDLVATATRGGLEVVRDDRPPVVFPLRDVRALAWSPDRRWLAAAGAETVYLLRMLNRDRRIRSLPIRATQIAWVRR